MKGIFSFLLILFIIAALFADNFVFSILYLLAGIYIFSRFWSSRSILSIRCTRSFTPRVFCGEDVPVQIELSNSSTLPILWLRIDESLPPELSSQAALKQVISLSSRGHTRLSYSMKARKRGYYTIGPLFASTGDPFGMVRERRTESQADSLIVYPQIVQFTKIEIPSHSPIGTLRHHQPIFEDPNRPMGKREYVSGDTLRRIDWKATASTGRLQVKQYEPSIAVSSVIFLNLNQDEYGQTRQFDSLELAILVAGSLANWMIAKRQSVGLITNGADPLAELKSFKPLLPRKGNSQLMRMLDILARVKYVQQQHFVGLLNGERMNFPWSSTLIFITGQADNVLLDKLLGFQQSGFNVMVILIGYTPDIHIARAYGKQFGFPVYHFRNELDLDIWRH